MRSLPLPRIFSRLFHRPSNGLSPSLSLPTPSFGLSLPSSTVPEAFSQLWRPHLCRRRFSRRPRWLAPSRTVSLPPISCQAPHPVSHAPSRKVSKFLSFFPLRDSYGTTQLVVHTPTTGDSLPDEHSKPSNLVTELEHIPVESTVLIHGHVRLRPEKQRRPVIAHFNSFRLSDHSFPDRPTF
jgi:hypothetical protein